MTAEHIADVVELAEDLHQPACPPCGYAGLVYSTAAAAQAVANAHRDGHNTQRPTP